MTRVGDVMAVKSAGLDMLAASVAGNASVQGADFGQVMQQKSTDTNFAATATAADAGKQKAAGDVKGNADTNQPAVTTPGESVGDKVQQAETTGLTDSTQAETPEETIVKLVTDVLGIDEETLETLMTQLGLVPLDLLQPENLQQLVLAVNGGTDVTDLLTNGTMLSELQELMQGMEELKATIELPAEFADALQQMDSMDTAMPTDMEPEASVADEKVIPVIIEKDGRAEHRQNLTDAKAEVPVETEQKATVTEQKAPTQGNDSQEESLPQYSEAQTELSEEPVQTTAQPVNPFNQFVTEAVKEPQMAQPPLQTVQIIEQIVQQIRISVQLTTTTMEMQLNPESLGKVLLSISMKEGMMTANFTVQTEEARMAIESQMYSLREALEQKELKVDAVEVTVSDFSFTRGEEEDQKNFEQGDGRSRRFRFEEDEDEETEATAQEDAERVRRSVMRDSGSSVDFTA